MNRRSTLLTIVAIGMLALHFTAQSAAIARPDLRRELLEMKKKDQDAREEGLHGGSRDLVRIDQENLKRLKEIVAAVGWPTTSMVGADGSEAAWLLVQHADSDPAFQLQMLTTLEPLVRTGDISPKDYAYLYDRTHKPQRYGTQGECDASAVWHPRAIESGADVDRRRVAIGLPPMREYNDVMNKVCAEFMANRH
jgi:hypothetical protein